MTPATQKHAPTEAPSLAWATVDRTLRDMTAEAEFIDVRVGDTVHKARRAKSCLVAPEPGDTVLCVSGAEWRVLAVVDSQDARTRLAVEGDLRVESCGGRVALASAHGVEVVTDGDLKLVSAELDVRAKSASVAVEELGFIACVVHAQITSRLALVAGHVDAAVDRIATRARTAFRLVEQLDVLRAGVIDARAERLLRLHGENAVITAKTVTKLDGAQIHLG